MKTMACLIGVYGRLSAAKLPFLQSTREGELDKNFFGEPAGARVRRAPRDPPDFFTGYYYLLPTVCNSAPATGRPPHWTARRGSRCRLARSRSRAPAAYWGESPYTLSTDSGLDKSYTEEAPDSRRRWSRRAAERPVEPPATCYKWVAYPVRCMRSQAARSGRK
jgi:hypothetical protein